MGDIKEVHLVKHIHNWYDACNKRGLTVRERISQLVDMHKYLMKFYDLEHFPMNTSYVCHLPSTTFQSIMQNISTRIHLYHLSRFKTYNHRSVSTLAVESLFLDLSSLAANTKWNTSGCKHSKTNFKDDTSQFGQRKARQMRI